MADDKLSLVIAERVNAEQEYQKAAEAVAVALRKKRQSEAKLKKAQAEEQKLRRAAENKDNQARTRKVKQEFLARVKELGCTWTGEEVDCPAGKRFYEGLHHYCVDNTLDGYLDAINRMESGVEDCRDPECDWCHNPEDPDRLVTCCLCHAETPAATAHLHQGEWICDGDCWDSRLKATE
jgi:hypothetical protein